jgi:hypothetical protein
MRRPRPAPVDDLTKGSLVYLLIDLEISRVELAEPDDTKRFHVAVAHGGDPARVDAVLASAGAGRLDPDDEDHAWIATSWVLANAHGRVHHKWSEHFDTMLQHGASKGWYDARRHEIKAHVEWIQADDGSIESGPAV